MGQPRKPGVIRESAAEQLMRDEEVLRANRELTAYFKGRRTEREARAALKIIKAFIRDRERLDATSRPQLPGAHVEKTPNKTANRKPASEGGERPRRKARRSPRGTLSKRVTAAADPQVHPELPASSESHEPTPE
jgi:hypothetical protein